MVAWIIRCRWPAPYTDGNEHDDRTQRDYAHQRRGVWVMDGRQPRGSADQEHNRGNSRHDVTSTFHKRSAFSVIRPAFRLSARG